MNKKTKERWIACCNEASGPLQELAQLQGGAQSEYDEMSEKRQQSAAGQFLYRLAEPNPDFTAMSDELDSIVAEIEDSMQS